MTNAVGSGRHPETPERAAGVRVDLGGGIERQANRFAARLLMPWEPIRAAVDSGTDTVAGLTRLFEVSRSAMSIRFEVPFETPDSRATARPKPGAAAAGSHQTPSRKRLTRLGATGATPVRATPCARSGSSRYPRGC